MIWTRTRAFYRRAIRPLLPGAFLDFVIIWGTLLWWAQLRAYGVYLPLAVAIALNIPRVHRSRAVIPVYAVVLLSCIDLLITSLLPLRCVSTVALWSCMLPTAGLLAWSWRRGSLSLQRVSHCLLPAIAASAAVTMVANIKPTSLRSSACARATGNRKLAPLAEFGSNSDKGRPRYLVSRPAKHDLLVVYRLPRGEQSIVDRLDLSTGKLSALALPADSECIGAYYDEGRDQTYLVTVVNPDPLKPTKYPKKLLVLDRDLAIAKSVDFPEIEYCDYNAYMFEYQGRIVIQGESTFFFDPATGTLVRNDVRTKGDHICLLSAETGFARINDTRFVVSGGGEVGLYLAFLLRPGPGGGGACLLDMKSGLVASYREAPLPGAWDVAYIPQRNELLMSSFWGSDVMFVDATTMREKRRFPIGPCVRPVAADGKRGIGYAAECFSGELVSFDIDTGQIRDRTFVGENARTIDVSADGDVTVASECGIFRLAR